RLEPVKHQAALEKLHQLPAASAKTWTKTSESYGEQFKVGMLQRHSRAFQTVRCDQLTASGRQLPV
ncbi:unnamed protein product, partial [Durusdinium trenchii]